MQSLSSNSLSSFFKSSYIIFHSTVTTLLKIHIDLILAMDRVRSLQSVFSTYSAAFDTVDHSIFLLVVKIVSVLMVLSLDWFSSCLSVRSQLSQSAITSLHHLLFPVCTPKFRPWHTPFQSLYNSSWFSDLKKSFKYHLYADDNQLYIFFHS